MPTVNAGSIASIHCPLDSTITVTPGATAKVSVQSVSSPSFLAATITDAKTLPVTAGDLVIITAIDADVTYTAPALSDAQVAAVALPGSETVLSKYGKTAYDITLANVTPASATNMTWSRTTERVRFGTETIKIQPTADTGCIMTFTGMSMTCDPADMIYSIDVYIETMPPSQPEGSAPNITLTLSTNAGLGANYTQWVLDNSGLRQGWNCIKMWAGDEVAGGYRGNNLPFGMTGTVAGTGFDFTQPAQYFGIRFSNMNNYVVHVDQVRRAAKAHPKIVIGFDATGAGSSDNTFPTKVAPLLQQHNIQPYFTTTWVYDYLYSGAASWTRAMKLYREFGWDAINHTWSHGATVPGRRITVTAASAADLATITFSDVHSIPVGMRFRAKINGATPSAFNGTFWMTATTTTQATYSAPGSGTGAATGTIYIDTLLADVWPTDTAEGRRFVTHEIADMSRLMRSAGLFRAAHLLAWPNNSVPNIDMVTSAAQEGRVVMGRGARYGNVSINEFGIDNPLHFGAWAFESSASLYTTQTMLKRKILAAIGRGESVFLFGHFILDETAPEYVAHVGADLDNPPGQGGNPAPPSAGVINGDGGWWYLGQLRQFLEWLALQRAAGTCEVLGYRDFARHHGFGAEGRV